jgi:hypothetical protein
MTNGRKATAEEAQQYVQHMARSFGCRIVDRDDAVEWQALRSALLAATKLELGKGIDIEDLAGKFSFTLGLLVYLRPGMTPDETIETVTHECEHVHQFKAGGGLQQAYLYVAEGEARARYEAYAYAAGDEIAWARFRRRPNPSGFSPLDGLAYMLTGPQKKFAESILKVRAAQTVRGIVKSVAAKEGIAYLKLKMSALLAK